MDQKGIDQKVINLYDSYTHGGMNRRTFFDRLVILAGGTAAATAMLSLLQNDYAKAETVAADDSRIKTETVTFTAGSHKALRLSRRAGGWRQASRCCGRA